MKRLGLLLIILIVFCSNVAYAIDFSGDYLIKGAKNLKISLSIKQSSLGKLSGTLISATGVEFKLNGMVREYVAMGTCVSDKGKVFFDAQFKGEKLMFTLFRAKEDGKRDYDTANKLVFTKKTG